MKKHLMCSTLLSLCLLFASCGTPKYRNDIPCSDIVNALTSEILSADSYARYSDDELTFLLEDRSLYNDCCYVYTRSSDDISEIAIFKSSQDVEALKAKIEEYAALQKKEKRSFLENYLPSERKKLDECEVRRFGEYVVFVVLDEVDKAIVFDKVEVLLEA